MPCPCHACLADRKGQAEPMARELNTKSLYKMTLQLSIDLKFKIDSMYIYRLSITLNLHINQIIERALSIIVPHITVSKYPTATTRTKSLLNNHRIPLIEFYQSNVSVRSIISLPRLPPVYTVAVHLLQHYTRPPSTH